MRNEITKKLDELHDKVCNLYYDGDPCPHAECHVRSVLHEAFDFALEQTAQSMDRRIEAAWNKSAEIERAACAAIADHHGSDRPDWFGRSAAEVIRARKTE